MGWTLGPKVKSADHILNSQKGVEALLKFVRSTGQLNALQVTILLELKSSLRLAVSMQISACLTPGPLWVCTTTLYHHPVPLSPMLDGHLPPGASARPLHRLGQHPNGTLAVSLFLSRARSSSGTARHLI